MARDGNTNATESRVDRRRFLKGAGASVVLSASLAGCTGGNGGDGGSDGSGSGGTTSGGGELADEITFMTWGGSFAESMKSAYAQPFQEEYGTKVNIAGASSGHEMLSRIQAGQEDVEIINPEQVPVFGPIKEGLIHPIRKENVSNFGKIKDSFNPQNVPYDPGEDEFFHIPHVYGGTGLVYNHEKVDEPSTWMDLFQEDLKGQQVFFNYVNYVVAQAAIALGIDFNEKAGDDAAMQEIWDFVGRRNDHVRQWSDSGSTTMDMFSNESALVGSLWIGRVNSIQDNGVPVTYTVPKNGAYYWVNTLNIPSYVEDPKRRTAEKFLGFMLREEPTAQFVKEQVYAPPIEYTETEPPEEISSNPDVKHADRLKSWDPAVYNEHKDDWNKKFQAITRQ